MEKTNTVTTSSSPLIGPSLKKSSSDKRFKLPSSIEHNRPGKTTFDAQEGEEGVNKEEEGEEQHEVDVDVDVTCENDDTTTVTSSQEQNGGEDADDDLELPPPMKPITEPILVTTANGPSGSTIPSELPGKRVSVRIFLKPLVFSLSLSSIVSLLIFKFYIYFYLYSLTVC